MSRKLLLQVTAPAVLIGLATVGGCVASLWSIHRLQANLNSILAGNVTSLEAATESEVKLRQLRFPTFLTGTAPFRRLHARPNVWLDSPFGPARRWADAGYFDRPAGARGPSRQSTWPV